MARVIIENVRKVYPGNVTAVQEFSAEIADGEFVVLVGPSGCGKSTVLRMVAGLEEISSGTIRIGERVVNDVPPKDRDIAMVFQNYALYPHMTVRENMAFGLKLRKMPRQEIEARVQEAAGILGLGALLIQRFNAFSRVAARICCRRKPMPKEVRKAYCAPYEENSIATLRFVKDIPLRPEDEAYDLVTEVQEKLSMFQHVPVLICWGDKDFVFDKHFLEKWIDIFPQAQVHNFPDCGHYVLEDATEEIIALIQNFLKGH